MTSTDNESWVVWELMGSTDGRTRGAMTALLGTTAASAAYQGWDLTLKLSSVGSDGHWPHVMGLWRVPDDATLGATLAHGWDDGVDEDGFTWGKSKLYRKLHGDLRAGDTAYLFEYLVADTPSALAALKTPDLVFAETLAPWQGVAVWSATDLFKLTEREWQGIGAVGAPGIREATGWWAVLTPDRDIV